MHIFLSLQQKKRKKISKKIGNNKSFPYICRARQEHANTFMVYDKEELENLILGQKKSYSFIGRKYGVSSSAIKKAARKLGIPLPRRRTVNDKENFSHKGYKKNSNVFRLSDEMFIKIINESDTWVEIGKRLGYKNKVLSANVKKAIETRSSMLGIKLNKSLNESSLVSEKTKGQLFNDRKNWQSARSAIQKDARKVFFEHNTSPKCAICGYNKHVEVAHIKAVSEFSDDAKLEEINSIDNLIGLCPNHHWEFDNGILKI